MNDDIQNLFVTYDIALLLKELDFNDPCIAYYDVWSLDKKFKMWRVDTETGTWMSNPNHNFIAAPLYQQVINWLDTKGIYISIQSSEVRYYNSSVNHIGFIIDISTQNSRLWDSTNEELLPPEPNSLYLRGEYRWKTRTEATKRAIGKALEILKDKK